MGNKLPLGVGGGAGNSHFALVAIICVLKEFKNNNLKA